MKSLRSLILVVQNDILGSNNKFLAAAWVTCLTLLLLLGVYLSSESRSFLGVADSRERQISFQYPTSIKEIHVISGQSVKMGDLLFELDQVELNEKIRLVQTQLARLVSEKAVRLELNKIVTNSISSEISDPLTVDIEDLSEQLEELEEQRKSSFVFAPFSGVIGSVTFRRGEKAPAFSSILTLSPDNPSYVEGFLHESLRTKLEVGNTVSVTPLSSQTAAFEGKIVSVGTRMILIPPRLAAYPNMQVYGREVIVELPPKNGLLLGERVQIKPRGFSISIPRATAASGAKSPFNSEAVKNSPADLALFKIPPSILKKYAFEPSGALYLPDLKKFLVISDDTDKQKSATLFLSNAEGEVQESVLTVPNLPKVTDLESISEDGGFIYLLSSQGLSKKNKIKTERNQFVRFKRSQLLITSVTSVELRPLLMEAFKASSDETLNSIYQLHSNDFEIEGHFTSGSELFLALKGPLKDNKALILKINDFNSIFDLKKLSAEQVSIAFEIEFTEVEGQPHKLSDLIVIKDQMYASTVCENETCGAVWHLKRDPKVSASLIKFFDGVKPEGLAWNSLKNSLFVTFDEKSNPAKFTWIEIK